MKRASIVLSALLIASASFAEDDPRRLKADQIFADGMKLHEKDKEKEALEKFKEAYAIYPSPNALFAMARVESVLSFDLEALKHFREAMKSPLLHPKNAELGKGYIAEIEARISRIDVRAKDGAAVEVDGAVFSEKTPLSRSIDVLPGDHTIKVDGVSRAVHANKGEVVHLSFLEEPPTPPPAALTAPSPSESKRSLVVPLVVGGVGVVALGAGVAFGVMSGSTRDEAVALRDASPGICSNPSSGGCAAYSDKLDSASTQKTVAIVSGITGGVLIGAAVAIALWPTKSATSAMIVPTYSNGAGASVVGRF